MNKMIRTIVILAATLFVPLTMAAENYVIEQGYFEDATNALSIDQVKTQSFTKYQDILTRGYSHSTFWVKLKIKGGDAGDTLILRLRPSYTDEVELFDPLDAISGTKTKRRMTGDMYPWSKDEYQSLNLNFKIKQVAVDRDIYLRVKSAHTYMLHAEALDMSGAQASDKKLELIYFSYLAFLLILFIWLLSAWALNREKVLGLFALTQLVAIFYAASMFGFSRVILDQVFSPYVLNSLTNYLIITYVAIALYAHTNLLDEYQLKRYFKWGLWLFIGISIYSGVLITLGRVTDGLQLNATSLLIATLFIAVTTYWGFLPEGVQPKRAILPKLYIRVYYTLLLVVLVVTLLPMMGVIKAVEFSLHALFTHGLLSGLMLFSLLQYRVKTINQMQMERILFESSKAEQEKIRREDQGRLIGMLTHELKNSLAVVDLAASSITSKLKGDSSTVDKNLVYISKAIDDINLVIARCIDVDRLDQEKLHVAMQSVNLADFFQELATEFHDRPRVHWDCDIPILVNIDPELLKVVVLNLIDNAMKYAQVDSDIFVKTATDAMQTSISMTNQVGYSGFPDEAKLFGKYYRAEKAQKDRGTGLGLWLSRSIARLMGAELSYERVGESVIFSIVWTHDEK